jgi:hypothetical protein
MAYLITPVTWDIMPDGSIRYYSNWRDITAEYMEQQKHIKDMLGTSYQILMNKLKQQIKGFDLDCSHWGEEQNIQLEIQGDEVLALFYLWEYAAEEYPNCRIGDTIGEWTCREIIVKDGCNDNAHSYLVLFTILRETK